MLNQIAFLARFLSTIVQRFLLQIEELVQGKLRIVHLDRQIGRGSGEIWGDMGIVARACKRLYGSLKGTYLTSMWLNDKRLTERGRKQGNGESVGGLGKACKRLYGSLNNA